jgi:hypothetical protein
MEKIRSNVRTIAIVVIAAMILPAVLWVLGAL